jgi:hypothetical protein
MKKWKIEYKEYYQKRENLSDEDMKLGEYIQNKKDFEGKLKNWKVNYAINKRKVKVRRIVTKARRKKASWIKRQEKQRAMLKLKS